MGVFPGVSIMNDIGKGDHMCFTRRVFQSASAATTLVKINGIPLSAQVVDIPVTHIDARKFARFVERNKKTLSLLARCAPVVASSLFSPNLVLAAASGAGSGGFGFFAGHGVILLHMLIVGFLTLLVTTFLKFTGRGDLAPLVIFVGGGVILYEVIGLFSDIYGAIKNFLAE